MSDIAVTEYTLPTTLAGMLSTIPLSLITVAIPRLSNYVGNGDKENYIVTLKNTSRIYMAILVPMSFGVIVLAREIMWLYSQDVYTYTYPVLMCAAVSRIIYGYQSIMTYLVMYVNGKEKRLTLLLFQGGVVNMILDFILVILGKFTPLSSLITTVLSVMVFIFSSARFAKRELGLQDIFLTKQIIGYFLISSSFILVSLCINYFNLGYVWNIALEIIICISIYAVYMIMTKDPLVKMLLGKIGIKW